MDISKKRKTDNGVNITTDVIQPSPSPSLTSQEARKILEPLTKDHLLNILQTLITRDPVALSATRSIADTNPTQRKLFIRGLGSETTSQTLQSTFSPFGDIEEAIVITEKPTGRSKGYGFVTFRHIDAAVFALRQPSKKIDGRVTVAQLAAAKGKGDVDVSMRKVYVGNVPFEVSAERLLGCFSAFGEIEEGPLGFDRQNGKEKGFAFFVYRTEEGARNAVGESVRSVDGHRVLCKMASDGKKWKVGDAAAAVAPHSGVMPGPGHGRITSFDGFSSGPPLPPYQNPHMNSWVPSEVNSGPGFRNNQVPPPFNGGGGGGGYASGGYTSGGFSGGPHYVDGSVAPEHHGLNNFASSVNRLPPSQGGYTDGGKYGPPSAYSAQSNLPPAGPRGPNGGMYQGGLSYY